MKIKLKLLSLFFALFLLPLAVMGQCGSNLFVNDADGNSYATLKVGPHCWMQSNLKTRVPGSSIYWADMYPDTTANLEIYGRLYNWYAAMNVQPGETPVVSDHGFVQGVCPEGWHLPNYVEVAQLMTNTTPALRDVHYWLLPGTNTTNYTMRPGGYYNAIMNRSENLCGDSYMWTAQSLDESSPSIVWSDCHCDYYLIDKTAADNGMSVRCVHRIYQAQVATVGVSNVKDHQADLTGEVIFAGYDENYTRGFIYGTDMEHPSGDTVQTGQSELGNYSFTINDLAENTTYHFRAYVVNDFDTVYGEWKTFTTPFMEVQTLNQIDNITMHMAKAYGNLTNMGGYESLNTGFLYGTSADALTNTAQREEAITATGNYDCVLNGLLSDTKYYYCAYLTNGRQTVYGDTLYFTTAHMGVETAAATNVTSNGATLNGTLTALKGYTICGGKFRYGQSEDALDVYTGSLTLDQEGLDFSADLTDLLPNTTYYFQAFAANGSDTVWAADTLTFTTLNLTVQDGQPCLGTPTVTDLNGNEYNTVKIGNQCWMKENLRTLTNGAGTGNIYTPTNPGYDVETYGLLYDWAAVMQGKSSTNYPAAGQVKVQGICPDGWHVPSDAEWDTLTYYVYNSANPDYKCSGCPSSGWEKSTKCIAKALSATTGWNSSTNTCAVGNYQSNNNATGFSAVPAGDDIAGYGNIAFFWSATQSGSNNAYCRGLEHYSAGVACEYNSKNYGFSVRCLRDPEAPAAMSVTTDSANTVTNNTATLHGNVTNMGGKDNVYAGFKYGTSESTLTSIAANEFVMYDTSRFSYTITGLTANTQYYYKAFAANGTDTVYGEVKNFTTAGVGYEGQPCPSAATVTDHQGNVYNTVQISNQCWTRENMRCTTSPSTGTNILEYPASSYSYSGKKAYYVNGSASNTAEYGLLYNWNAAVDTFNTSYGETSTNTEISNAPSVTFSGNRRGICPEGWHVPSNAEWTQLTDYVSSQSQYECGNGTIVKALASTTGWNSSTETCAVGNIPDNNNKTGFSALPASYYGGSYNNFGNFANLWSATEYSSTKAYGRGLTNANTNVFKGSSDKSHAFSVRCLRD